MANQDGVDLLARAIEQGEAVVAGIRPDLAELPTPCPAWDVRGLVNHMVLDLRHFDERVRGEPRSEDGDVLGEDWAESYRAAAGALLQAWRADGALDRTIEAQNGKMPARWFLGQHLLDIAVHDWDLAVATGQSAELDPDVARAALAWAKENIKPEFRGEEGTGKSFGVEVPVPEDAPVYERLVGFMGRDPGWTSG